MKSGTWAAPFWGKKGYSTGRDPLGMQIASIGTYAILLPGLTNLTRRIRYYSFYCWAIDRYARNETNTDPEMFRRFIRRAELQFAYGMAIIFPKSPAVVGKDWADRYLREHKDTLPDDHLIDLAKGADQTGGATYWKYNLGAFGQYFLGSLLHLGLIREREGSPGVYLCTDTGLRLAECFKLSLDDAHADQFIESVQSGHSKVQHLRSVMPTITLDGIVPDSSEWTTLLELLLGADDGGRTEAKTYFRKQTILSYLKFLAQPSGTGQIQFSKYIYNALIDTDFSSAAKVNQGWFIYELNELAHYSVGAVLWGLLEVLGEKGYPVPYRSLEHELTDNTVAALSELSQGALGAQSTPLEAIQYAQTKALTEDALEKSIQENMQAKQPYPAMASGLLLSLLLFQRIRAKKDSITSFATTNRMSRDGDFSDLVNFIDTYQTKTLHNTITVLLRRNVVNRHIEESVRKMGSGIRNTLKFTNEDGKLFHVQTVGPQRTQPRLGSLHQFLVDLKILTDARAVTGHGTILLEDAPDG